MHHFRNQSIASLVIILNLACVHMEPASNLAEAHQLSRSEGHLINFAPNAVVDLQGQPTERMTVVEYFADWCEVCKRITPDMARLAKQLQSQATVGIFNTSSYPDFAKELDVEIFPTFEVFLPHHPSIRFTGADKLPAMKQLVLEYPNLPDPYQFRQAELQVSPQFFLVGGATDINNFGLEVLWHTAFLQEIGIAPEQTACYFKQPEIQNYFTDRPDYLLLAKNAKACFELSKTKLLTDIENSLQQGIDQIYIYQDAPENLLLQVQDG